MEKRIYNQDSLERVKEELLESLKSCSLCPRRCGVNRREEELGFCKTGRYAKVDSAFLHFGEEPELVGRGGSGTIFFSYCNLGCLYCQNYTISHLGEGRTVSPEDLAAMMLLLQRQGAENINFVTPTHVIAQIIEGLCIAVKKGLHLPLVYNCGGYESRKTLTLLEGVIDIYMPDVKYSDSAVAQRLSSAPDYWEVVQAAVAQMHRQVGPLHIEGERATRGLLIRHLVLPQRRAGSFAVLDFIKEKLSLHTHVNIMQQYRPCYKAYSIPEVSRRPSAQEYEEVVEYARKIGLYRGF